jgi:hypothetical protein
MVTTAPDDRVSYYQTSVIPGLMFGSRESVRVVYATLKPGRLGEA